MNASPESSSVLQWEAGYTSSLLNAVESRWGFQFQPDLRQLLESHKPVGKGIWDWETATDDDMKRSRLWIARGFAFDAIYNDFWLDLWGEKPATEGAPANWSAADARQFVTRFAEQFVAPKLSKIPPLIPIFGHRFMPSAPHVEGLPILSIMQTDIIYYGNDLRDYFHHEFNIDIGSEFGTIHDRTDPDKAAPTPLKPAFWSDVMDQRWSRR